MTRYIVTIFMCHHTGKRNFKKDNAFLNRIRYKLTSRGYVSVRIGAMQYAGDINVDGKKEAMEVYDMVVKYFKEETVGDAHSRVILRKQKDLLDANIVGVGNHSRCKTTRTDRNR